MKQFYGNNTAQSFSDNDEYMYKILQNMADDSYYCHHCVQKYITCTNVSNIFQIYDDNALRKRELFDFRLILNLFGVLNAISVFIIYGGPPVIIIFTSINSICILIAPFIENLNHMMYLDSFIVLVAIVVCSQLLYGLLIGILEVNTILLKKNQ